MENKVEKAIDGSDTLLPMPADEARAKTQWIKQNLQTARQLLLEMYEREGWRALGYSSWRDYGHVEFGYSESRAYQLMAAARTERNIFHNCGKDRQGSSFSTKVEKVDDHLLIPETHLRPLTSLDPDLQRQAWQQVIETAPGGRITAAHVEQVVNSLLAPEPEPDPAPIEDEKEPPGPRTGAPVCVPPSQENGKTAPSPSHPPPQKTTSRSAPPAGDAPLFTIQNGQAVIGEMPDQVVLNLADVGRIQVQCFYGSPAVPIDALLSAIYELSGVVVVQPTTSAAAAASPARPAAAPPTPPATETRHQPAHPPPDYFPSHDAAIWWAIGRGAFGDYKAGREAYQTCNSWWHQTTTKERSERWIKYIEDKLAGVTT